MSSSTLSSQNTMPPSSQNTMPPCSEIKSESHLQEGSNRPSIKHVLRKLRPVVTPSIWQRIIHMLERFVLVHREEISQKTQLDAAELLYRRQLVSQRFQVAILEFITVDALRLAYLEAACPNEFTSARTPNELEEVAPKERSRQLKRKITTELLPQAGELTGLDALKRVCTEASQAR